MRSCTVLVSTLVVLAIVGCGPRAQPPQPEPKHDDVRQPEPTYEGMPLSHWIAQTRDTSPTFRRTAATALSHMAPESAAARRALVALLEDKDWRVRQAAARILGEVGPAAKESVPDLIRLLQDKYGDVRWAAAKALGEMGPAA